MAQGDGRSGSQNRGGDRRGGERRPGGQEGRSRSEIESDPSDGRKVAGPKEWGSLGRRGAGRLSDGPVDNRNSVGASGRDDRPDPGHEQARWERVEDAPAGRRHEEQGARSAPRGTQGRSKAPRRESRQSAEALTPKQRRGRDARRAGAGTAGAAARAELVSTLGATRGARANERLRDAAHAFERERFEEARNLLRPIAEAAPRASTVRELLGLSYYRLGRWKEAVRELEAFRQLTGTTEQHPVLADAYRALNRRNEVEELWDELRESSLSADLVTEGRIVMAGSLADQGRLDEAIDLLFKSQRTMKRPEIHVLRQGYSLADLYERAGEVARARELFRWIVKCEPEFADAAERAGSLS